MRDKQLFIKDIYLYTNKIYLEVNVKFRKSFDIEDIINFIN